MVVVELAADVADLPAVVAVVDSVDVVEAAVASPLEAGEEVASLAAVVAVVVDSPVAVVVVAAVVEDTRRCIDDVHYTLGLRCSIGRCSKLTCKRDDEHDICRQTNYAMTTPMLLVHKDVFIRVHFSFLTATSPWGPGTGPGTLRCPRGPSLIWRVLWPNVRH